MANKKVVEEINAWEEFVDNVKTALNITIIAILCTPGIVGTVVIFNCIVDFFNKVN